MALYEDRVRLMVGDDALDIFEGYTVRIAVINQPASFEFTIGAPGDVQRLVQRYGGYERFSIDINEARVQTGRTGGFTESNHSGATMLTVRGTDNMGRLARSFIRSDVSFKEQMSFELLVLYVLEQVGLTDDIKAVVTSDQASRGFMTGGKVKFQQRPVTVIEESTRLAATLAGIPGASSIPGKINETFKKTIYKTVKAKAGTRWRDFLNRQLERAGLFLWAGVDDTLILDVPNPYQQPLAKLVRKRGARLTRGVTNIESSSWSNNFERRYTKCEVLGRAGGKKTKGRGRLRGLFVDFEMVDLMGSEDAQVLTIHDDTVKNQRQADNLAQRRMAEINRGNWHLNYTVAGHSTPSLLGPGRVVWSPNTVVDVDDEHYGIRGEYYVETCTFFSRPYRGTTLTLMRPRDLFFASDAELAVPEVDLVLD